MCKWGAETLLTVTIPASLSYTGAERKAVKGIDSCIADIVKALNEGGVKNGFLVLRSRETRREHFAC